MKGIKSISTNLFKPIVKHKLMLFIIAVSIIALALPGAFVLASENNSASQASANATISGKVLDFNGKAIDLSKKPYVEIAWVNSSFEGDETYFELTSTDGSFSVSGLPSDIFVGIITAGADGYANEILAFTTSSMTGKNFKLSPGSNCTFVNEEEELDQYIICEGSYAVTKDGYRIPPEWIPLPSIPIGAGIPTLGAPAKAKFTENKQNGTLTYYYKSPVDFEEYNIIFKATPETGYKFNYWLINGEAVPSSSYFVDVTKDTIIKPYFTGGEPPVPPETVDVSATLYDHDQRTTPITEGGYAYILGMRTTTLDLYLSDYGLTDKYGKFTIKDVPKDVVGVLVVGAPGYSNRGQFYSLPDYPATDFYLSKGVQCDVKLPDSVNTVYLEKGSKINMSYEGFDTGDLILEEDVDFGKYILPFGMSFHGTFNFMDDGRINFSVVHNEFTINSLSATFRVDAKPGYVFNHWEKDGKPISGEYKLREGEKDFVIAPVLVEVGSTITYSAPIYNEDKKPLTDGYAYLIGCYPDTLKPYLSDMVGTDKNGVFTISNVPKDVIGIIIVGAPGYVNRFQYVDAQTPATFFTLKKGVQCSFDMPETASTVYLAKGTCIKASFDIGDIKVPFEYELEEDLDFGNYFVPFGMSFDGIFTFNNDGSLSYAFTRESNRFDINYLKVNIKVLPKEGYVFKDWLKDGEVVTGTEFKLESGTSDFVISPVFVEAYSPEPAPINPSWTTKTFDNVGDLFAFMAIFTAAFTIVFTIKTLRRKQS